MHPTIPTLLFVIALIGSAGADIPFWGDKASMPSETDPVALKPGQFIWEGEAVRSGPIVLVVSLDEQRAYVYRNGIRIGVTSVSTGKPGHTTPTGVFTTLQKDKAHRSKTYNNAPMPYTERLTWDGVALHAGGLPGYPSSHGCVHLPSEFARLLFGITDLGLTVVVAKQGTAPTDVVHPAALAPVDPKSGAPVDVPRLSGEQAFRWEPEKAPDGPVTVLLSRADLRALVFRNGVEIGRARITIDQPEKPLGTHAFTVIRGHEPSGSHGTRASLGRRRCTWSQRGSGAGARPDRRGTRTPTAWTGRARPPTPDAGRHDARHRSARAGAHHRTVAHGGHGGPAGRRVSTRSQDSL